MLSLNCCSCTLESVPRELQFSVDGTKVFGREMMRKTVSSVQVDSGRTNTFSVRRPRRGWDPFTVFVDSQERLMLLDSGAGNLAEVLEADGKELSVQHEVCRTPIGAHAFSRDRRWLVVAGDNTNDIWVHDIESW